MNLCATQDNVILKAKFVSGITSGGIVMPGVKQFEDGAEVISIGPNVDDIAVGDTVIRPDPPRFTVTDEKTEELFWLVAEADILAKILPDIDLVPITSPARLLVDGVLKHTADCSFALEQGGSPCNCGGGLKMVKGGKQFPNKGVKDEQKDQG